MGEPRVVTRHIHEWGPVEYGRFTGEPHRKCQGWVDDLHICGAVSLDLDDEGLLYADDECACPAGYTLATNEHGDTWCGKCGERLLLDA